MYRNGNRHPECQKIRRSSFSIISGVGFLVFPYSEMTGIPVFSIHLVVYFFRRVRQLPLNPCSGAKMVMSIHLFFRERKSTKILIANKRCMIYYQSYFFYLLVDLNIAPVDLLLFLCSDKQSDMTIVK